MSRPKITVLCEDKQHEAFIRRFLRKRKKRNQVRAVTRPNTGAGEQFVRENYPAYLDAVRKRGGLLVVMIDADTYSIEQRLKQMDGACEQKHVLPRTASDKVASLYSRAQYRDLACLPGRRACERDGHLSPASTRARLSEACGRTRADVYGGKITTPIPSIAGSRLP